MRSHVLSNTLPVPLAHLLCAPYLLIPSQRTCAKCLRAHHMRTAGVPLVCRGDASSSPGAEGGHGGNLAGDHSR